MRISYYYIQERFILTICYLYFAIIRLDHTTVSYPIIYCTLLYYPNTLLYYTIYTNTNTNTRLILFYTILPIILILILILN